MTVDNVITVIKAQLRVSGANFLITGLRFWGTDGFESKPIKVTDAATNRAYEDEASGGKRPVCGFTYPPTMQKVYALGTADAAVLTFHKDVEICHASILLWT
jgi:hypothetical protein